MKKIKGHFWSPSHPSTRPIRPIRHKNRRGRLVPRCGILGESTERLEYCLNVEGWINSNICNFLLFSPGSITVMNATAVDESRVRFFF